MLANLAKALTHLARCAARHFFKSLQGFFHLAAFGFGQGVERVLFFGGREFKKLVEPGGDLAALGFRKRVPMRAIGLAWLATKRFSAGLLLMSTCAK